jgi:hypothetical protein
MLSNDMYAIRCPVEMLNFIFIPNGACVAVAVAAAEVPKGEPAV